MLKLGPHTVEVKNLGIVTFEIEISREGKPNTITGILIRAVIKTIREKLLAFTK